MRHPQVCFMVEAQTILLVVIGRFQVNCTIGLLELVLVSGLV